MSKAKGTLQTSDKPLLSAKPQTLQKTRTAAKPQTVRQTAARIRKTKAETNLTPKAALNKGTAAGIVRVEKKKEAPVRHTQGRRVISGPQMPAERPNISQILTLTGKRPPSMRSNAGAHVPKGTLPMIPLGGM
ncbi:MAG: hypothetical protein IJ239_05165 [Eubacterium sp.]|nr:hypothetical protein [Eubacterium sp.]